MRRLSRFWDLVMLYADWLLIAWILIWIVLLAGSHGCSATKDIARAVIDVKNHATDIRSDVKDVRAAMKANDMTTADAKLTSIDGHATVIQDRADDALKRLPDTDDKTPTWLSAIKWIAFIVGIVAAAAIVGFLAWRMNLLLWAEEKIQAFVSWVAKIAGA